MTNHHLRIAVLTTGRQDWGILRSTCGAIVSSSELGLVLLAGGMHLSARHGMTIAQVRDDGFVPDAEVAWLDDGVDGDPPASVQAGRALELVGDALERLRPDALLIAGDRLETAAAALAATLARVPLVHVHGGEVTLGAFDDQLRNAVTKLAHLHLASHAEHARRIVAMGEDPASVYVVGAPGLDSAFRPDLPDRAALERELGHALVPPVVLVTVHAATLDPDPVAGWAAVAGAMGEVPATYVVTLPNADPGGSRIREHWRTWAAKAGRSAIIVDALGERRYWGLMRVADAMLGNSSSGIVEAPAVDLPAVNVGTRQEGRRREANVIDAPADAPAVARALRRALDPVFRERIAAAHPSGLDGRAGHRIASILAGWTPPSPPRKRPVEIAS